MVGAPLSPSTIVRGYRWKQRERSWETGSKPRQMVLFISLSLSFPIRETGATFGLPRGSTGGVGDSSLGGGKMMLAVPGVPFLGDCGGGFRMRAAFLRLLHSLGPHPGGLFSPRAHQIWLRKPLFPYLGVGAGEGFASCGHMQGHFS